MSRLLSKPWVLVPVLVVAVLNLGVTGTAVAGHLLTGKDVKNGSLRGKDLKKGTITDREVSAKTLQGLTGPAGPQGPKGDQGTQGIQGIQGIQGPTGPAQVVIRIGSTISVAAGDNGSIGVNCHAGERATGGGVSGGGTLIHESFPTTGNQALPAEGATATGWHVSAVNGTGTTQQLTAYVMCAS
jgi:hypothetical protein